MSPSYDNGIVNGCFNLNEKSMCVFDAAKPDSLVATICARADVDCSRGIVTGGHSQGAGLALLAREHDARVEAVWAMGGTCDYLLNQDTGLCDPNGAATDTDCAHFSQTTIDPSRIRIVNGENDEYGARVEYERITGRVCPPTEMSCLAADGSGWFVIPNAAVQDGNADHCYVVNSTDGAWCPGIDATHPLDIRWLPPSRETWSLLTNLEWLASFAR